MKIKLKKLHEDAIIPSFGTPGSAAVDLVAVSRTQPNDNLFFEYDCGFAIEIPEGYCGKIYARSSISNKDLYIANGVGIIDSDYRGPIKVRMVMKRVPCNNRKLYEVGDRVAQLIIEKLVPVEYEVVNELSSTERGTGGYGSTGN